MVLLHFFDVLVLASLVAVETPIIGRMQGEPVDCPCGGRETRRSRPWAKLDLSLSDDRMKI